MTIPSPTAEMIEHVARALVIADERDPDELTLPETPVWVAYIPDAKAAILAMHSLSPSDGELAENLGKLVTYLVAEGEDEAAQLVRQAIERLAASPNPESLQEDDNG